MTTKWTRYVERRRRMKISAILVACAMAMAACGSNSNEGDGGGDGVTSIKVGQIASLTGIGGGPWGKPVDNALKLAFAEIKESGFLADSGLELELETLDDATEPTQAVTAFNKLEGSGIDLMVSSGYTPIVTALTPLANDSKVVLFGVGSAGTGDDKDDFYFRVNDPVGPTQSMVKQLKDLGVKRPGLVLDGDNPAFKFIADTAGKGFEGGFVETQTVAAADTDFSSALTKLDKAGVDGIVLSILPEASGNFLRQMSQISGLKDVPVGGNVSWTDLVAEIAGPSAGKAIFGTIWAPGSPGSEQFYAAYTKKFDSEPSGYAALGYNTGWLLATAIKLAKAAGDDVSAESVRKLIKQAAVSPEFKERQIIPDYVYDDNGAPSFPGVVAAFDKSGKIVAFGG